ncbi:4Fe-4S binding protein [Ferrimonas senticii]|uniref:4Fe-4S binding protein n=1 Tax=Ferrimonas senticii TaxID=394566 RepID=UPI000402039D|nr:4Fe-4S binding protein [Ferrimonas senticii]
MTLIESISLLLGLTYAGSLLYFGGQKWGAAAMALMLLAALLAAMVWPLLLGALIAAGLYGLLLTFKPQLAKGEGRENAIREPIAHFFGLSMLLVGLQYLAYHLALMNGFGGYLTRPDVVDAFLPLAGGIEIKAIVTLGLWDQAHPAAAVMLFTVMLSAVVCKRAFCGWACPLGLAGTYLYKLRKRFIKGDALPPAWIDWPLRMVKYLLFVALCYLVIFGLPTMALPGYLSGHYHLMADAKMGAFFLKPTLISGTVIALILLLAAWQQQGFCRYLCPYGAGLGLLSMLSPFKVRRNVDACLINSKGMKCDKCSRACPARIAVHQRITVRSDECQACLRCVSACPKKEALALSSRWGWQLSARGVAVVMMLLLFALPLAAFIGGFWHSAVTDEIRAYLLPYLHQLGM